MLRAGPGETPARHFYELISTHAFDGISVQCKKHWLSANAATPSGRTVAANGRSIWWLYAANAKTNWRFAKPNTGNEPKAAG